MLCIPGELRCLCFAFGVKDKAGVRGNKVVFKEDGGQAFGFLPALFYELLCSVALFLKELL